MKKFLLIILGIIGASGSIFSQCNYQIFPEYIQLNTNQTIHAENTWYWVCNGVTIHVESSDAGTFFMEENSTLIFDQAAIGCDAVYAKDGCTIINNSPGCVGIGGNSATVTVQNLGTGFCMITYNCTNMTFNYSMVPDTSCAVANSMQTQLENDAEGLNVFPNPSQGYFTIMSDQNDDIQLMRIQTMQGSTVKTIPIQKQKNISVEASELLPGCYIMNITTSNKTITKRIFITN